MTSASGKAMVEIDRLIKRFGPETAVDNFNISISEGEFVTLLGPSGCGKTTLLNIISGLISPTQGRVLFDGRDVTDITTGQRHIAQVFQFPVVYDTMTVYDNLAFPLRNRGVNANRVSSRVAEISGMLDLDGMLQRKARGLAERVVRYVEPRERGRGGGQRERQ